jgi:predicted nucleic acid-binding protein
LTLLCADTSSWIAFLAGEAGKDVEIIEQALGSQGLVMAPPVLTELLSDPRLPERYRLAFGAVALLEIQNGFWSRSGALRASLIRRGHRPKLADTLIAQICIDHSVPLLTRDRDFAPFARDAGLRLVLRGAGVP